MLKIALHLIKRQVIKLFVNILCQINIDLNFNCFVVLVYFKFIFKHFVAITSLVCWPSSATAQGIICLQPETLSILPSNSSLLSPLKCLILPSGAILRLKSINMITLFVLQLTKVNIAIVKTTTKHKYLKLYFTFHLKINLHFYYSIFKW